MNYFAACGGTWLITGLGDGLVWGAMKGSSGWAAISRSCKAQIDKETFIKGLDGMKRCFFPLGVMAGTAPLPAHIFAEFWHNKDAEMETGIARIPVVAPCEEMHQSMLLCGSYEEVVTAFRVLSAASLREAETILRDGKCL